VESFGHGSKRRVQLLDMNEIQERKGMSMFGCLKQFTTQTCHMQLSTILCNKMMAWTLDF
jgi:hypothetical protein